MKLAFLADLLFSKEEVVFPSDFSTEKSVERLGAQVRRWPFFSPFRQTLLGRVGRNKVTICRVVPLVSNSFAPVFYGSFREQEGVTVLQGYFAMPLFTRVFSALWFGLGLSIALLATLAVLSGAPTTSSPPMSQWQAKLMFLGITYGVLGFGVLLLVWGKRIGRKDVTYISTQIRVALEPRD